MRRTLIGIITLALLLTAALLYFALSTVEEAQFWMGACVRVGCVMGVLWLAWPQVSRIHPWLLLAGLGVLIVGLVALKRDPRILLMGLVILIVLARTRRTA